MENYKGLILSFYSEQGRDYANQLSKTLKMFSIANLMYKEMSYRYTSTEVIVNDFLKSLENKGIKLTIRSIASENVAVLMENSFNDLVSVFNCKLLSFKDEPQYFECEAKTINMDEVNLRLEDLKDYIEIFYIDADTIRLTILTQNIASLKNNLLREVFNKSI